MKMMTWNDCINCPVSEIDLRKQRKHGGEVRCESSGNIPNDNTIGNFEEITMGIVKIPGWCPMDNEKDFQDATVYAFKKHELLDYLDKRFEKIDKKNDGKRNTVEEGMLMILKELMDKFCYWTCNYK